MPRIICPYCADPYDSDHNPCPSTGITIPRRYVDDYKDIPPLWLLTTGWEQVGKTTYLTMLVLALQRAADYFQGNWFKTLGSETLRTIREMREQLETRQRAPKATPADSEPSPLLLQVFKLPGCEPRCLVLHDVPGQKFRDFAPTEQLKALRRVQTIWFMISLPDLPKQHFQLSDLFNIYYEALETQGSDPSQCKVIVTYTKADSSSFPDEIKDYLSDDPLGNLLQGVDPQVAASVEQQLISGEYQARMQEISDQLERYTKESIPGGASFVSMVRASGMQLVFCLTSALGAATSGEGRSLVADARPHRILDPLLWALALEQPQEYANLSLVIDHRLQQSGSATEVVEPIWEALSHVAELETYALGNSWHYPNHEDMLLELRLTTSARAPLLGPLLEIIPETRTIVLVLEELPLDAEVLRDPALNHRFLIVWTNQGHRVGLPNEVVCPPGSNTQDIVRRALQLCQRDS